jgi:hypothetical protein
MADLVFTEGDIADLEALTAEFRPDDWILEAPGTPVDDGQGGAVVPWTTVTSGTAAAGTGCRLLPAGYQAREQIMQERPTAIGAWTVYLPIGTPVQTQDRLVIDGRSFYLTGAGAGDSDSWAIYVQVGAAEVR